MQHHGPGPDPNYAKLATMRDVRNTPLMLHRYKNGKLELRVLRPSTYLKAPFDPTEPGRAATSLLAKIALEEQPK